MLPVLSLLALPALAQNAVDVSGVFTVSDGAGAPTLTFAGNTEGRIDVAVTCAGKRFTLAQGIAPGSAHTLRLTGLPQGQHACTGRLDLETADGATGQMPLNVTVAVLPPMKLEAPEDDLDLEGRGLLLVSDRAMKQVEVTVYGGDAGERIGATTLQLGGVERAPISWDSTGEILRIDLLVTDTFGSRSTLTLLPWSYQIPHEDVVFESGKAVIRADEEPKLEAAWGHIEATLTKYGDIVDMELFVAGYTDTVGAAAANQALSERRAQAIARWFRKRGFTRPIWTQGFGETVLAVGTPDETDEAANRRSVYVLAADTPRPSGDLPRASWTPLP